MMGDEAPRNDARTPPPPPRTGEPSTPRTPLECPSPLECPYDGFTLEGEGGGESAGLGGGGLGGSGVASAGLGCGGALVPDVLNTVKPIRGIVISAFGEVSADTHSLVKEIATQGGHKMYALMGLIGTIGTIAARGYAQLLLARLSALAPIAAQCGNTTNSNQQIISLNALARAHYRRSIGTRAFRTWSFAPSGADTGDMDVEPPQAPLNTPPDARGDAPARALPLLPLIGTGKLPRSALGGAAIGVELCVSTLFLCKPGQGVQVEPRCGPFGWAYAVGRYVDERAPREWNSGACGVAAAGDDREARLIGLCAHLAKVLPDGANIEIVPWFVSEGRVMFVLTARVAITSQQRRAAGGKRRGAAVGGEPHVGGMSARAGRSVRLAAKRALAAAERAQAPVPVPADAGIEELVVPPPVTDVATGVAAAPAADAPADAPAAEVSLLSTLQVLLPALHIE
ncbi:hypothetical protein T492DRAFT_857821 [Pavlovales sp. CCMP2436]|nr:hypothetical protein T492DRAFT_857821 [Pavlovales sp. CCMP2436]